jgi:hypothetical protein
MSFVCTISSNVSSRRSSVSVSEVSISSDASFRAPVAALASVFGAAAAAAKVGAAAVRARGATAPPRRPLRVSAEHVHVCWTLFRL